jgi:hypothetical protein
MVSKLSGVIRIIYGTAFLIAMAVNVSMAIEYVPALGWRLGDIPIFSCLLWYSLILLDPIVSGLLLVSPKKGLLLAGAVAFSGVAHNTWFMFSFSQPPDALYWLSIGFLVFYAITVVPAWRGVKARENP